MRSSKEQKPKEAKKIHEAKRRVVEMTVIFLNLYRFQGSESESLKRTE